MRFGKKDHQPSAVLSRTKCRHFLRDVINDIQKHKPHFRFSLQRGCPAVRLQCIATVLRRVNARLARELGELGK